MTGSEPASWNPAPTASGRIIVALDVSSREKAIGLVKTLRGSVGMFKVGSQLYLACGPSIVDEIVGLGERVFLDLKFHDIPNTVSHAAVEAGRRGITMMTVHTSGGRAMMAVAVAALEKQFGARRPWVVGVTVLTSMNDEALREVGVERTASEQVKHLALLAEASGVDGLVCSPLETAMLRAELSRPLKLVTPGVRMRGDSEGDQARVATPGAAIRAGADYVVIGRPITEAEDPGQAVSRVAEDIVSVSQE